MPWWPSFIVKPRLKLTRPRLGTPTRPPDMVIFGLILLVVLFVVGGNVYTLVKAPPAIAGSSSGPIVVYPAVDAQLGMEGIVVSCVVFIGTLGLGVLYYASKFVFQPGYATRLMVLAVMLSGVAFLILTYLMQMKTS